MRITLALGHTQAWLAAGYRQATPLERALILPTWLLFRALFVAAFTYQCWRHRHLLNT